MNTVKPFNLAAKIFNVFSHTDNLVTIKFSVLTFIDNKLLLFTKLLEFSVQIFSTKYNGTLKFLLLQYSPSPQRLSLPPGVSRRASDPMTSPVKPKPTPLLEPSLVPKDGIGHFAHLPQYLKIMDACKAAYTNYQVRWNITEGLRQWVVHCVQLIANLCLALGVISHQYSGAL